MLAHAAPLIETLPAATHAVVMGDLVSSEDTASVEALHSRFNAAVQWANEAHGPSIVSPLTITLGDEFQGLCASLKGGLGVVRDLRAQLLADGIGCRFVLGAVRLETPVNRARAWNMMGPGLAGSRQRLGDKRDVNAYRFELRGEPELQALMEAVGASLTQIEDSWTDRQREVVLALRAESAAPLAERLGMSAQTLYKIRRAGRFDLYERQWAALEAMAGRLDRALGLR
ncbi:MAG: SatD family protein [Phenylobacterium sp.]|uniref:SatD family protein n=1 Tax=Phenylobacterium sp. TaxID=1871053 RepID=UPI00271BDE9D|nr:SatD family protein [Phenylobacterium sp.]MDO8408945.1 SatD family protein [Phenylobacterium sp.]